MSQDHNHLNHATWRKGKSLDRLSRMWNASCGIFWVINPGEGILRLDGRAERGEDPRLHQNEEATDKQLDQLHLKLASSWSPVSRPRILYNRLWRFPFKPPALLGVIGFNAFLARHPLPAAR